MRTPLSDAQKWRLGDAWRAASAGVMQAEQRLLEPTLSVTEAAKADLDACRARQARLLEESGVTREILQGFAVIAGVFPPGDPMRRSGLSFSHARAIGRVRQAGERSAWIDRALEASLSVGRLQAEINATRSRQASASELRDARPSGARHTSVCAWSGRAIADVTRMVELRVHPASALAAAWTAFLARAGRVRTRRGGAAKLGRNRRLPEAPLTARFADAAALTAWLTALQPPTDDQTSTDIQNVDR